MVYLLCLEARFYRREDVLPGSISSSAAPWTDHSVRVQQRTAVCSRQLRENTGQTDFGHF